MSANSDGRGRFFDKEGPSPSFIVESPSGPLPQAGEGTNGPTGYMVDSIDRRHGYRSTDRMEGPADGMDGDLCRG